MNWRIAMLMFLAAPAADESMALIVDSGRVLEMVESPSERLQPPLRVSPGQPPVLRFRYFDAADRGRFGDIGLVTDDAGH